MKTLNAKIVTKYKQATRTEAATLVTQVLVNTPVGIVSCRDMAEAEKLAESFGAKINVLVVDNVNVAG